MSSLLKDPALLKMLFFLGAKEGGNFHTIVTWIVATISPTCI